VTAWNLHRQLRSWRGPFEWSAGGRRRLCRGAPCGLPREGSSPSPIFRRAASSSRHRAQSPVPYQGPCAALDEAPHVGPPYDERLDSSGVAQLHW